MLPIGPVKLWAAAITLQYNQAFQQPFLGLIHSEIESCALQAWHAGIVQCKLLASHDGQDEQAGKSRLVGQACCHERA